MIGHKGASQRQQFAAGAGNLPVPRGVVKGASQHPGLLQPVAEQSTALDRMVGEIDRQLQRLDRQIEGRKAMAPRLGKSFDWRALGRLEREAEALRERRVGFVAERERVGRARRAVRQDWPQIFLEVAASRLSPSILSDLVDECERVRGQSWPLGRDMVKGRPHVVSRTVVMS